jgi:hypothetical protein
MLIFEDLPSVAAEEGGDLGGVHAAAATHPHHPAHPGHLYTELKGLCHEKNKFLEGLKNQISTFCICADSYYGEIKRQNFGLLL